MTGMKMARANDDDIKAALDLCSALESLERYGSMPDGVEGSEHFDDDNAEDCKRALAHLLAIARRGSMFRVVFGMTVALDPRNRIFDPDADTLELHPSLTRAPEAVPPAQPQEQKA